MDQKIEKIEHWGAKARKYAPGASPGGAFLARRVPGAASRARTSEEKKRQRSRRAAGARSDTPWADGPANLIAYAHSAWPGFRAASFANFYQNRTKWDQNRPQMGPIWARGGGVGGGEGAPENQRK